jgi:cytochrome c oxidase subunit 3
MVGEPQPESPNVSQRYGGKQLHVPGAGTMGISLLVGSLSILFLSSLIGYICYWYSFPRSITVHLPWGLWLSTAVLIFSSFTIHWAWLAIRNDLQRSTRIALLATLILGITFLGLQCWNWAEIYGALQSADQALKALHPQYVSPIGGMRMAHALIYEKQALFAAFYFFTVLHAMHVVGGLIPLGVVNAKARQNVYSRNYHPGIRYCLIYWHFLDAAWILILITLLVTFK